MIQFVKVNDVDKSIEILNNFSTIFPDLKTRVYDLKDYAKKLIEKGNFFIAKENENVLGLVAFYSNNIDMGGYISLIGVSEIFQGRGIGKILLNEAIKIMIKDGMNKLKLEVNKSNINAQEFYKHMGFKYIEDSDKDRIYLEKDIKKHGL